MAGELNVLCAGAVKGLVLALQGAFGHASGLRLHATFGAVGAIRDALRAGAPCDVFIATDAMIGSLQANGDLRAATQRAIGRVQTAMAVKAFGAAAVDSAESLKAALLASQRALLPRRDLVDRRRARRRDPQEAARFRDALAARMRMFAQRRDRDARARRRRRARDRLHAGDQESATRRA